MKIALVYPPSWELNLKGYPLGLAYLSASLKRKHQVDIYNYNGRDYKKSIADFFASVKKNKPKVVGISFTSFNRWGAYCILKSIKKINKDIIVVLGGVHPSALYSQIFQYFYKQIDFIIQSEGEGSLLDLCDSLDSGLEYNGISGLVYKDKKQGIIVNPVNRIARDLDELPMPDLSFCAQEIKERQFAYLITSRGCPVNCYFCSTSSFWGQNVRMNSPERVGQEVDYAKSLGAKRIFFHDDTFNLGIERTIRLAQILKEKHIEYAVSCRVKPVNEEMIAKLVESGCRHITWGAESLSDKILKSIDKKITKEQVKAAFDLCVKYADRMTTSGFFCVGMPGETEETIKETVGYLNNNIRSTHGPGASMLYILPGTRLYKDLVKEKAFNEKIWVKSDSVYYYVREHGMRTLNRWRKMVNRSGIRLAFKAKHFWDYAADGSQAIPSGVMSRLIKISKKIKRSINFMRNRY
jgi:radical SAM superfamily enzyme YgiQ (UPF0313 family)